MNGFLIATILALTNRFGSVNVDTIGARVLSYVPVGGSEIFAMLPSGYGGIPLCWPWFQFNGPHGKGSPKHGLARYREFAIAERMETADRGRLVLRLKSDAETRREWPNDFVLTLTVELSEKGLSLELLSKNEGTVPFAITEAFHPYLRREALALLQDTGSGIFRTWDPDATSHLKTQGLGPDDWKKFVCVENGAFLEEQAIVIPPGGCHRLTRLFAPSVSQLGCKTNANSGC